MILQGCTISNDALAALPAMTLLEELDLSNTNISAQNLASILANAPKLKALDLSHCENLLDEMLNDLNLQSLETLNLRYTNISPRI